MRRSIGAMLAVVILSGVARADEDAAVKFVDKLGGRIIRDDKQPGEPVIEVRLYEANLTDADLKELKELKQLTELNLSFTRVTDAGLMELKFQCLQSRLRNKVRMR